MSARKLIVFKHDNALGNAPAHTLFDRVHVGRVEGEADTPARHYADYTVTIDRDNLPEGVSIEEML